MINDFKVTKMNKGRLKPGVCYSCGLPFEIGQTVHRTGYRRGKKYRHLKCWRRLFY